MSKLFKLICVGLLSIFIGVVSSSVCAKRGGNPGGPGKASTHGNKHFKSMGKSHKAFGDKSVSHGLKTKFSDNDRETITNFFSTHPINTTGLPPGIAMNLARGKPLPPGIAKTFLPKDLSDLLGANQNYDYLLAGKDVLLVNKSDQIIADILHNVLH